MSDAPPLDLSTNAPPSSSTAAAETVDPLSSAAIAAASHHSKRQRRPSVRLGDPGEQPASALSSLIKPLHTWRSSKSRQLTHLPSSSSLAADIDDDDDHPISVSFRRGPRDSKHKKTPILPTTKRIRSNWASPRVDDAVPAILPSDSRPLSPSDNETDGRDWNIIENGVHTNDNENTNGGGGRSEEDDEDDDVIGGVRSWLNKLGLGRYAPVFEIHEVDDEVLPLLTLEDLKDMGINAVGSRRKMYCEIQKLKTSLQ